MMTETLTPALDPATPYLGDNGRMFCGALRCAGSSAHFTGHGISGQPVMPLGEDEFSELRELGCEPRCEGCGTEAS